MDEAVVFSLITVDGMIFAKRTLVNPAIEKNEIISATTRHTGRVHLGRDHLGIDDVDTQAGSSPGYLRYHGEPLVRFDLPVVVCSRLGSRRVAAQTGGRGSTLFLNFRGQFWTLKGDISQS